MNPHARYINLKPMSIDEIDLDSLDKIMVRLTNSDGDVALIAMTPETILLPDTASAVTRREAFSRMITALSDCATGSTHVEIVRWRDRHRVWHTHRGPSDRHLAIGDLVTIRPDTNLGSSTSIKPGDTGHVVSIGFDASSARHHATIVVDAPGVPTINVWLRDLSYADAPDLDVVA